MLQINWWKKLKWKVKIWWSKNASLPIIAACLIIKWKTILRNVPEIWDIFTYLDILSWIWVKYSFEKNTLIIDSSKIEKNKFDLNKIKKIRASILLVAPILERLWNISIPLPGWCNLWVRSIYKHLKWLEKIWYNYEYKNELVYFSWKPKSWEIILEAWFWVTPTENMIVANVLRKGRTTIRLSALEPHVLNLIDFLRKAWADIGIRYDHSIIINWVDSLKSDFSFDIISDYIQSGTYAVIWALASEEYIDIENSRITDLYSFLEKMEEAWVKFEDLWNDTLRVYRSKELKATNIQTNIFPGFPTDLQSPFAVLQTQSKGMSKIHEILFEGRLGWLVELESIWADISILNPHEVLIKWKTNLASWKTLKSWDLRAGASMIIAWLITEWTTNVENIEYVYRGYENIVENLTKLWADIKEVKLVQKNKL